MKTRVYIIMSVIVVALLAGCIATYVSGDRTAPEITLSDEHITYEEGGLQAALLQGVTAKDDVDGDITGRVRISEVSVLKGGTKAVVTYAVYDDANNLGKATRTVDYVASSDKAEAEEAEQEASTEADTEVTTEEKIVDVPEGYEDLPLESDGKPVVRLTTHEVQIPVGGYFDSMEYVEDVVDDKDTREALYRGLYLEGEYDTYTAGKYELTYYCVDSDGNVSNFAKLMLTVGDADDEED